MSSGSYLCCSVTYRGNMPINKYLVVGRGCVGQVFQDHERFECISHKEWWNTKNTSEEYEGFVCTAGLIGEDVCAYETFYKIVHANVTLPMSMLQEARRQRKPFIAMSTGSVYRGNGHVSEGFDVHPHNRYVASKIMMEYKLACSDPENIFHYSAKWFIFRLPFVDLGTEHPNDLKGRSQSWAQVEDVTTSIVTREDILNATLQALTKSAYLSSSVYNIASISVRLPEYLKETFGRFAFETVKAGSLGKLRADKVLLTDKAKKMGLL